jgi:ribosomal protein S18 acetylase RimI-like enzyme
MAGGLRSAASRAGDYRAIWQCIGDAYDVSRPGGRFATVPTEEGFREYFTSESADPRLWFVAWQGSRVAGQILCRVRERCGEVFEVSVGYGHRRKGLARALLLQGLAALQGRGVQVIRPIPCMRIRRRLYEQVGFRKVAVFPRWRKAFSV